MTNSDKMSKQEKAKISAAKKALEDFEHVISLNQNRLLTDQAELWKKMS